MPMPGATCSRPSGLCDRTSTTFRFGLIAIVRATDLKRTNRARTGDRSRRATNGAWLMMDKIQRAILENQVILAEALWMLLHSQGISSDATLQNVSARIRATRKLLEEHSEENP